MQDEHFMRQWNAGHVRFSGDLDRALYKAAGGVLRRLGNRQPIDRTYNEGSETPLARKARLARNAVIGGITIGVSLALTPLGAVCIYRIQIMAQARWTKPMKAVRVFSQRRAILRKRLSLLKKHST